MPPPERLGFPPFLGTIIIGIMLYFFWFFNDNQGVARDHTLIKE
tara:strand:+ start:441 stop:572 length:132 start_codon:yes stop_codon:yes gene_type:complete